MISNDGGVIGNLPIFPYPLGNRSIIGNAPKFKLWTPSEITTSLWLDASDEDTITEVGGAVSQWDDKSGNGNNAVQGDGANQPSSGERTLNNKNVIDSLPSQFMSIPNFTPSSGNLSIFIIGAVDSVVNIFDAIVGLGIDGGSDPASFQWDAGQAGVFRGRMNTNTATIFTNPNPAPGPSIYSMIFNFDLKTITGHIDGSQIGQVTNYNTKLSTSGTYNYNILTNRNQSAGIDGFAGEIIFSEYCDNACRFIIEGYLAWKWGTQSLLPVTHPYKNSPPRV